MSIKFVCMILTAFFQFLCKLLQYLLACRCTCINTIDVKSLCNRRSQYFNFWFCPKTEERKFVSSNPRSWKPCQSKLNFPYEARSHMPLCSCGPDPWSIPRIPESTHGCSTAWGGSRRKEVHAPFCSSSNRENNKDHNLYSRWWNVQVEKLILLVCLVFGFFLLLGVGWLLKEWRHFYSDLIQQRVQCFISAFPEIIF